MLYTEEKFKGAIYVLIRPAHISDLDNIHRLVAYYALQGALLPRTRESLMDYLPRLGVAMDGENVAGIVALHQLEPLIGEVRTLAVDPGYHKKGIGQLLVQYAVAQAEAAGLQKLVSFTRQVEFFTRCGFAVIARESVPIKYFTDCQGCPMLAHCDETAMARNLVANRAKFHELSPYLSPAARIPPSATATGK